MSPYRIIIADDHVIFRKGIKRIIEEVAGLVVIGEGGDGVEVLELLKVLTPDMVILDVSMPNMRGIEATKEIKILHPRVKVLILTMHKNPEYFFHATSAGAEGFLLKQDADTDLIHAIERIRNGKNFISPRLIDRLSLHISRLERDTRGTPNDGLTLREREVLKLIAEGKSSQEISILLKISTRTVDHHKENIKRKLRIKNLAQLIRYAIVKGYSDLEL